MKTNYTHSDLMSMSIIELTTIADNAQIEIQDSIRHGLVSDILSMQSQANRKPSELHSRDRYAMIYGLKTAIVAVSLIALSSCAMQKPGSKALHRTVRIEQETQQYQASISSGKDWTRVYRNQYRRPHKMTRIPLTQWYIF